MDADATRLVFNILSTGFSTIVVENVVLEGQKKETPESVSSMKSCFVSN